MSSANEGSKRRVGVETRLVRIEAELKRVKGVFRELAASQRSAFNQVKLQWESAIAKLDDLGNGDDEQ